MPDSRDAVASSSSESPDPLTQLPRELSGFVAALADRYAIERELGRGGMATVYLARDVRHDRRVALKVLNPELGAVLGAERFLAEIKVTANLKHPNLLPLFDSGEAAGHLFYVMPFIEGESLRARLEREKQLPVEEAVRITGAVAHALDSAHRHGVIHRDLKPENILLQDGQPLVADFGIALAVSNAGGQRITQTGLSLGTPAYMSPEQATGDRVIDGRTDIYSLGAVCYEMLSGEPPHTGATAQAVIARLMTEEPRPLTVLRRAVPAHVDAAVRRALEKLPADRFPTAQAFAESLEGRGATGLGAIGAMTTATRGPAASAVRPRRSVSQLLLPGASAAVAALAVGWAVLRPTPSPPLAYWSLTMPASQAPNPDFRAIPSPDGSRIIYVGPAPQERTQIQLWVKPRDREDATPIPGTTGVWNFTFSPDGEWIVFEQGARLKKMPVAGGAAVTIADSVATLQPGIAWLDDGTIVYVLVLGRELRRVFDTGGAPSSIVRADLASFRQPAPLPGSRGLLFVRFIAGGSLWVHDLRSGQSRRLIDGAAAAQYVPTGHIVYGRPDGAIFAVPFDARSLELRGTPVPVRDSVAVSPLSFDALFDVSRSGLLVVRSGTVAGREYRMVWVDRAGRETPLDTAWRFRPSGVIASRSGWALSPDGRRLAIALENAGVNDIWVKQIPDGPLARVTFDSTGAMRPRWSPDGRRIVYMGDDVRHMRQISPDGAAGRASTILGGSADVSEGGWSPDGKWLVARVRAGTGRVNRDLVAMRPGVDSAPVPIVASRYEEAAFALSPDGKWIAYESDESGRKEIYVRPFPDTDAGRHLVSTGGGFAPLWSRDGRELFYASEAREMMAVATGTGPAFGSPRPLFKIPAEYYGSGADYYTPWDVAPDGRFLMARLVARDAGQEPPLTVVENWFEELRRKTGRR